MSEDPAAYEDLFAPWGVVGARRMFGGLGLYHNGLMFGLVADGVLYLKTDALNHEDFASAGGRPFVYAGKGKPVTMSYWTPPAAIYDDEGEMRRFATLAHDAALRAAQAKTPRRRRLGVLE